MSVLYMFMYVYTYLYIFMHNKFFTIFFYLDNNRYLCFNLAIILSLLIHLRLCDQTPFIKNLLKIFFFLIVHHILFFVLEMK